MLLIVLSFLVAAACVSGNPACDDMERKCSGGGPHIDPMPTTAEGLDDSCKFSLRVLDCQINFIKRCPSIKYTSKEALEAMRELYGNLCSNTDLRRIYLENIVCVKELGESDKECAREYKDFCKDDDCFRPKLAKTCGTEGVELFDAFMKALKMGTCKGEKLLRKRRD